MPPPESTRAAGKCGGSRSSRAAAHWCGGVVQRRKQRLEPFLVALRGGITQSLREREMLHFAAASMR